MFNLFKYLKWQYWFLVVIIAIFSVGRVFCEIQIPQCLNEVLRNATTPNNDSRNLIMTSGIIMLAYVGASFILYILSMTIANYIAGKWVFNVKKHLYIKISGFTHEETSKFSPEFLLNVSTETSNSIKAFFNSFFIVLTFCPTMLGLGIYYMVQTSAMLTLIIICFLIICIVVISILAGKISNSSVRHLNSCDKYKQFLREDIVGLKTIKATNSEDFFVDKNNKLNSNIVTAFAKVDVTNSTMNYIFTFFSTFTLVLIYFFASVIIKHGFSEISVVDIIYFSILSGVVSSAIVSSAFFLGSMPYNFALFKRINMILKFKSSADSYDKGKNISDLSIKGNLIFNNVSFKYPNSNELTLENISFSIRQGETLAIVGPTGSGKTTLINLIPKLIKLTEGEIIFDGVFINDISLKALRSRIGYISQKNILLNDTIYENISFGVADNKKNLEDVVDSAKISNAGEFVEKMPEKYQSYISENASNLSGGQKQRIAIARALIIKPEFLIFDDSFSALDFKTDLTIRKNIKKTMNETTFIIVAQRISTIINADKIVVLNKGKMVGYGKHTDLFEKCEIYREMVINQLGEKADTGGFDA